jgi:hypothetical protein
MTNNKTQSKLDLDYFESVLLYNALTDSEYLSSIISYTDPSFFVDKNIGKVIDCISLFFTERGTVPSLTEIKARFVSEEDKKALAEIKTKLSGLQGPFNKEELISNTEKFLKERLVYKTVLNVAENFSNQTSALDSILLDFEKAYNISLKEN